MHKANLRGWFSFYSFNHLEYEKLARYENGDINWIVPNKILAFSSPDDRPTSKHGNPSRKVLRNLQEIGVKNILRLNEPFYDKRIFTENNINHFDIEYPDGTNPPDEVVAKTKTIWKNLKGPIAIHCRAGLGRTGTQIGIFMMSSYGFTARESICWMRMCRNGMVIAQQSDYLCRKERYHYNPENNIETNNLSQSYASNQKTT